MDAEQRRVAAARSEVGGLHEETAHRGAVRAPRSELLGRAQAHLVEPLVVSGQSAQGPTFEGVDFGGLAIAGGEDGHPPVLAQGKGGDHALARGESLHRSSRGGDTGGVGRAVIDHEEGEGRAVLRPAGRRYRSVEARGEGAGRTSRRGNDHELVLCVRVVPGFGALEIGDQASVGTEDGRARTAIVVVARVGGEGSSRSAGLRLHHEDVGIVRAVGIGARAFAHEGDPLAVG